MRKPTLGLLAIGALVSSPALIRADAELVRSGGVIGGSLTYTLDGDPLELYVLGFSFNTGPLPLALIDPLDPHVLELGIDLVTYWPVGLLDGAGAAQVVVPVPNNPNLHGQAFHAQFFTAPGPISFSDDLSKRCSLMLGLQDGSTQTVGDKPQSLDGHSVTALADGRVLLAGGAVGGTTNQDGFLIFDPQTQDFSAAGGTMQHPRAAHTATLLSDGRVLLVGGTDGADAVTATVDIWDPVTETVTGAASLPGPRTQHTATLLNDGRVLVVGGASAYDLTDIFATLTTLLDGSLVYDPLADSWSGGPNLPGDRIGHSATLLGNGQVLVAGGLEVTFFLTIPIPAIVNTCRRYNPATNGYLTASSMNGARALHGALALNSGDALVAGGAIADLNPLAPSATPLATCEVYDYSSNSWTSVAALNGARGFASLINTGSTIVCLGGITSVDPTTFSGTPALTIEETDQQLLGWTQSGSMLLARLLANPVAIDGGQRILSTGVGDNGNPLVDDRTAEIYIP